MWKAMVIECIFMIVCTKVTVLSIFFKDRFIYGFICDTIDCDGAVLVLLQ